MKTAIAKLSVLVCAAVLIVFSSTNAVCAADVITEEPAPAEAAAEVVTNDVPDETVTVDAPAPAEEAAEEVQEEAAEAEISDSEEEILSDEESADSVAESPEKAPEAAEKAAADAPQESAEDTDAVPMHETFGTVYQRVTEGSGYADVTDLKISGTLADQLFGFLGQYADSISFAMDADGNITYVFFNEIGEDEFIDDEEDEDDDDAEDVTADDVEEEENEDVDDAEETEDVSVESLYQEIYQRLLENDGYASVCDLDIPVEAEDGIAMFLAQYHDVILFVSGEDGYLVNVIFGDEDADEDVDDDDADSEVFDAFEDAEDTEDIEEIEEISAVDIETEEAPVSLPLENEQSPEEPVGALMGLAFVVTAAVKYLTGIM